MILGCGAHSPKTRLSVVIWKADIASAEKSVLNLYDSQLFSVLPYGEVVFFPKEDSISE